MIHRQLAVPDLYSLGIPCRTCSNSHEWQMLAFSVTMTLGLDLTSDYPNVMVMRRDFQQMKIAAGRHLLFAVTGTLICAVFASQSIPTA